MGAGASLSSDEFLQTHPEVEDLCEKEVEELYDHLKSEYEKKLKEIKVRHLENVLVSQLSESNANARVTEVTDSGEDISAKPNVPQRLLSKLLDEQSVSALNNSAQPTKQIKQKALSILGDHELESLSRELLPEKAKVTKKALQKLGEESILPERVQKRLGSPMTPEQLKAQKQETQKEELAAKKQQQKDEQTGQKLQHKEV